MEIRVKIPNIEDLIFNGFVVHEDIAKSTPCTCYEYEIHGEKKQLCWSPGVVGTLSDEQEKLYCPDKNVKPISHELQERLRHIGEIARRCRKGMEFRTESGRYKVIKDITDRLECLSVELKKAGIEM